MAQHCRNTHTCCRRRHRSWWCHAAVSFPVRAYLHVQTLPSPQNANIQRRKKMIFFPFISSIMAWEPIDDGGSPISWSNGNPETQWRMSSSYPSSSMNWSTAESKLSNGINEWSQPGCTSFNASQISDTNASPLNWEDSDNTVGFLGSGWRFCHKNQNTHLQW